MTIPVHKLVCGNCNLRRDTGCNLQGVPVEVLRLACFQIHSNFEDRGFAREKAPEIDLAPILAEVDVLMRQERALDRKFVKTMKKEGQDGRFLIGCYWYQFWDNKKQVWKVPSLAWVKEGGSL